MPVPFLGGETDYQKTIDRIIELERSRITRIETNLSEQELKLSSIQDLKGQIGDVASILNQLAGINSAFRDVRGISSDTQSIEAFVKTNDRRVQQGTYELEVTQVSKNHIIASKPIRTQRSQGTQELPSGELTFLLSNEPYTTTFSGGDPEDFTTWINEEETLQDNFQASYIKRRELESIVVLASKHTGLKNSIRLKKDKKHIMRTLGLFKSNPPIRIPLIETAVMDELRSNAGFADTTRDGYTVTRIPPQAAFELPVGKPIDFTTAASLNFYFFTINADIEAVNSETTLEHLSEELPQEDSPPYLTAILYYSVLNEARKDPAPSSRKALIKSSDIFFSLALIDDYSLSLVNEKKVFIDKLVFTNESLEQTYLYSHPMIELKRTNRDPFIPTKTLQTAQDAALKYQGIQVERPTNSIDDLIPGVIFNIKKPSSEPVSITLEQDKASILTSITNFILAYNELIEVLNIYLSTDEDALGNPELNETYLERVGILRNDFRITRLKVGLRSLLTRPYSTTLGSELIFFSQIGLEPVFNPQTAFNISSDKINFNQTVFNSAIENFGPALNDLFSYDTNTDGLPDTGLIIELQNLLNQYLDRRGGLSLQETALNTDIENLRDDITEEEARLDERRRKLEQDFSEVEALRTQQDSVRSWLDSLQGN